MTRRHILATDAQERAMLAAIRSLHGAGFRVSAVATTRTAPGLWSAAVDERRVAPDPRRDADAFVERIESIVSCERHDVLLAGMDASLFAVSRGREQLEPHVQLALPSHDVVDRVLDKAYVAREAAEVGLAGPDARLCAAPVEAVRTANALGYPVLIKPVRTVVPADGGVCRWASVVARDPEVVERAARAFGACLVQERVEGDVLSFGGVATDRGLLAYVVSRYARTWPARGGNVAFSETVEPPAGLTERVEALVARLRWTGLFELELIVREGGELSAIDFNPRAYGSLSLAIAAGVPLPALWCQWLLGERPEVARARIGVRYRWGDADLRHLVWSLRCGRPRDALAIARPHRAVAHAYFKLRDPVPAVARWVQIAQLAWERRRDRRLG